MTRAAWAFAGTIGGLIAALSGLFILFAVLVGPLVGLAAALIVGGALTVWFCLVAVDTDDRGTP